MSTFTVGDIVLFYAPGVGRLSEEKWVRGYKSVGVVMPGSPGNLHPADAYLVMFKNRAGFYTGGYSQKALIRIGHISEFGVEL